MTRNARNTPEQLRARIQQVSDTLDSIAIYLTACGEAIARDGLFCDTVLLDSHRKPVTTRRPNIHLRAQRELLRSQKALQRYVQMLEQQLETATEPENEWVFD